MQFFVIYRTFTGILWCSFDKEFVACCAVCLAGTDVYGDAALLLYQLNITVSGLDILRCRVMAVNMNLSMALAAIFSFVGYEF